MHEQTKLTKTAVKIINFSLLDYREVENNLEPLNREHFNLIRKAVLS